MNNGITDIKTIKSQLINYNEVILPYTLKKNSNIKYLTLVDGIELFFKGGIFEKMGNNKIIIRNGSFVKGIPINIKNNNSNIIYKSRFFIEKERKKEDTPEVKKLKEIIKSQEMVIKKLTETIKQDKLKIQKYES